MRTFIEFLKTTISGGLFVLLPIMLFVLMLGEILQLMVGLATPIADLFPKGSFDQAKFPVLIALILIVGVSFLIGVAMRSASGRRFGTWVERNTIGRLPMYIALKNIFNGFIRKKDEDAFRPALLKSSDGEELAYLVEDLGNDKVTVLVPWAPTPFAGSVKIVDRDRVELLDTDLGEFTKVLSLWGVGSGELIGKNIDKADIQKVSANDNKTK